MHPNTPQNMAEFGEQLARLHQYQGSENYGLSFDTWLGPQYQPNEWGSHWAKFFSEQRIGWQLQLCAEKNLHFGDKEKSLKPLLHYWQNISRNPRFYTAICGLKLR